MDQHDYQTLVKSLEVDATINPTTFRNKVVLISSAAYIALFGLLAVMIALLWLGISYAYSHRQTVNLIRIGLFALVMAPVFFVVLRMFFMRLPPPRRAAPERRRGAETVQPAQQDAQETERPAHPSRGDQRRL